MKALICEMCNSNNIIKQDGYYVCQNCGTKYTVEEAKKMMIDGVVDVSGSTVKVDNTASVGNYLKIAQSAYDSSNNKEAENYCNRIIEIDPENHEAWMLKGKAAGWQSTLKNIRIEESVNCFTKAIDNAPDDLKDDYKREASDAIARMSRALIGTCCKYFADYPSEENYKDITGAVKLTNLYGLKLLVKCGVKADGLKKEVATIINNAAMDAWNNKVTKDYYDETHPSKHSWERFIERGDYVIGLLRIAIDLCDDDNAADEIRYENAIDVQQRLVNSKAYFYYSSEYSDRWVPYGLNSREKELRNQEIMKWHNEIKKINPSYEIPTTKPNTAPNNTRNTTPSGGCYIATAVYGSYDCPQVWTLRRYRDYSLAETWYGRVFIRTYYAISPTLVKWFGHTEWFKNLWRGKLDRMVYKLNSSGFENTPYQDRNW